MQKAVVITLLTFFSFFSMNVYSQKDKIPCTTEVYKQFDFWLGDWNVYDTNNKLIGTNTIVKMPNACAMQENWSSTQSASKGTSYNYYNAIDKSWNQVWIDNAGGSLVLKGTYKNNKMILKSKLITGKKGDYYNQVTWFKNSNGSVTQLWELLDINNTSFNEIFRGTYKKITK
jgi:hypothetical protein